MNFVHCAPNLQFLTSSCCWRQQIKKYEVEMVSGTTKVMHNFMSLSLCPHAGKETRIWISTQRQALLVHLLVLCKKGRQSGDWCVPCNKHNLLWSEIYPNLTAEIGRLLRTGKIRRNSVACVEVWLWFWRSEFLVILSFVLESGMRLVW